MTKKQGFSLIELMISLFILSLLMTLMMQQYLLAKRQYLELRTVLEEILEVQLVSDLIRGSLRSASFTPCAAVETLEGLDHRNANRPLLGLDISKKKSLKINHMDENFSIIITIPSLNHLVIKAKRVYEPKQKVLLADCYHAEVLEVVKTEKTEEGTKVSFKNPLHFNYHPPVYLGEWIEEEFLIKKNLEGSLALFYKQNRAEELSSLISDLSVRLLEQKLVEVELGLRNRKKLKINTRVRS